MKSNAKAKQKQEPEPLSMKYDAARFAENMTKATQLWQVIVQTLAINYMDKPNLGHTDPLSVADTFMKLGTKMAADPTHMWQMQMGMMKDHLSLWQDTTRKLLGKVDPEPVTDRRFKDAAWSDSLVFDYLKQTYLINAEWANQSVKAVDGLDKHTANKASFFTRQILDALSPSNFLLTNPEAMRLTMESNAENLVHGLKNLLDDLLRGDGKLRISMTDPDAFELGKDIACTPGKVVYQNVLMQLIQYEPTTPKVHEVPLLVIPAWINKYYVLDMRPENSCLKWALDQGYTVFVISWVNPDEKLSHKTFNHYLTEGPLAAIDVIREITGQPAVNAVGYCLGGTLLSITLAYLQAKGKADLVKSATFLTTMVDFSEAGDLSVFIDEAQLRSLEARMSEKGYLDADDMAMTFNMLRSNDLIWSFVINNYLLGKDPFPFDLLYWNSDSTRMPARMHSYYLRNMYQKNLLVRAGGIEVNDTPINISKVRTPMYILSTKDDHIAPWKSTYMATQVYDGPMVFTLAESGHIAGVVNPPGKDKYGHWTNNALPARADDWFKGAKEQKGSWWPHWSAWQKQHAGKLIPARKVGSAKHKPIEDAPGSYVRVRS